MLTLNGTALPSPSSLSVSVTAQRGSVRFNSLGQRLLDGQCEKTTVEILWARMEPSALSTLAQLLASGGFFTLVYPDPLSGQRSISCHVTERSAQVFSLRGTQPAFCQVRLKLEER